MLGEGCSEACELITGRSADAERRADQSPRQLRVADLAMVRSIPVCLSLVLGPLLVLAGCGDEGCPDVATSCPDGCYPMRATPYDVDRGCFANAGGVVGCTTDAVGTDDAPCVKRLSDGALFIASQGSPFRRSAGWAECRDDEIPMSTVSCPD